MTRELLFTTACLAAAACASHGVIEESSLAPKPGETLYCMSSKLEDIDDALHCNWNAQKQEACRYEYRPARVAKSAVSAPQKGGWCNNGEHLVEVTAR